MAAERAGVDVDLGGDADGGSGSGDGPAAAAAAGAAPLRRSRVPAARAASALGSAIGTFVATTQQIVAAAQSGGVGAPPTARRIHGILCDLFEINGAVTSGDGTPGTPAAGAVKGDPGWLVGEDAAVSGDDVAKPSADSVDGVLPTPVRESEEELAAAWEAAWEASGVETTPAKRTHTMAASEKTSKAGAFGDAFSHLKKRDGADSGGGAEDGGGEDDLKNFSTPATSSGSGMKRSQTAGAARSYRAGSPCSAHAYARTRELRRAATRARLCTPGSNWGSLGSLASLGSEGSDRSGGGGGGRRATPARPRLGRLSSAPAKCQSTVSVPATHGKLEEKNAAGLHGREKKNDRVAAPRVKAAPVGSLLSVLALRMAELGELRSLAFLWTEFVKEVRWYWESMLLIPLETAEVEASWDRPTAPPPNFANGLLHQKLQMLNCCILAKARLEERARERTRAPPEPALPSTMYQAASGDPPPAADGAPGYESEPDDTAESEARRAVRRQSSGAATFATCGSGDVGEAVHATQEKNENAEDEEDSDEFFSADEEEREGDDRAAGAVPAAAAAAPPASAPVAPRPPTPPPAAGRTPRRGALRAVGDLRLLLTGRRLCEPETQDAAPPTEDVVLERQRVFAKPVKLFVRGITK